jgi:hypothetical protein
MEAIDDLIVRLRERWSEPTVVKRGSCGGCGVLGDLYTHKQVDLPPTLEAAVPVIARPFMSSRIRECRTCGALFKETWGGPAAADDLFDITTEVLRVSPEYVLGLLRLGKGARRR